MTLNEIKIRGLYGLYDYDLDFADIKESDVRFITAPNGFGKTTILRLIENFFNRSMTLFVSPKLVYKEVEFHMPQYTVRITQKRTVNDDINSDDILDKIEATVSVYAAKGRILIEEKTINQQDVEQNNDNLLPSSLNVYLRTRRPRLVADNRLWVNEGEYEHIVRLSRKVGDLISERDEQIAKNVNRLAFVYANKRQAFNDEIGKLRAGIVRLLARYHSVGLALEFNDTMIMDKDNPMSVSYLIALNETLSAKDSYLLKLECFAKWVNQCEFANKKLILQKDNGVVFEINDGLSTKILPEELSSGEKQMVVQAIELLFNSQDISIVLIDEPELSYHVAWQMVYLKNIRQVSKLSRIQYIIATHNPQMFNYDWDLSIDLYAQSKLLHNTREQ